MRTDPPELMVVSGMITPDGAVGAGGGVGAPVWHGPLTKAVGGEQKRSRSKQI